jgi:CRISPR/Cas system CSM-associated protein Csm3 (group 7 of RAMP superfamily)
MVVLMTPRLSFELEFHGPFRIATGGAKPGIDATVDHDVPLPATALKGVARHTASTVLGLRTAVVAEVFGDERRAAPWAWGDAEFPDGALVTSTQAQVRIDPETGTVDESARGLLFAEQLWCAPGSRATVEVEPIAALPPDDMARQAVVIIASMCAVHSLGSARRRGLGRVSVSLASATGLEQTGVDLGPSAWAESVAARIIEMRAGS